MYVHGMDVMCTAWWVMSCVCIICSYARQWRRFRRRRGPVSPRFIAEAVGRQAQWNGAQRTTECRYVHCTNAAMHLPRSYVYGRVYVKLIAYVRGSIWNSFPMLLIQMKSQKKIWKCIIKGIYLVIVTLPLLVQESPNLENTIQEKSNDWWKWLRR